MAKKLDEDSEVSEMSEVSSEASEVSEMSEVSSEVSEMSDIHSEVSEMSEVSSEASEVSEMSEMSDMSSVRSEVSEMSNAQSDVSKSKSRFNPLEDKTETRATGAASLDNFSSTEGLLRDMPAPVIVELGRLQFNTSQVIRLKEGQILRLPRNPSEPVDLIVHGKVFAKAELVEVDGELGVRILHLTGSH